jgi:superfamily II DNA or RNA helicase
MIELRFGDGTLEIRGDVPRALMPASVRLDPRSACLRAPADAYRAVALALHNAKIPFRDDARRWTTTPWPQRQAREPRPFQTDAVAAWRAAGRRGVVVLPTGAGKSHVAVLAIEDAARPALIVAPTLDLVRQWHQTLTTAFGVDVGVVGGGEHVVLPLTVTTYDSAWSHMRHLGSQFGLLVFDEVHHLPGESYRSAAEMSLAPFRLGLTATPERSDGAEASYAHLVGPIVHRAEIVEMSGVWLADYDTEHVIVDMDDDERGDYEDARAIYRAFTRAQGIRMAEPGGFARFLSLSSSSVEGREALGAYRLQRRLALSSRAKLRALGGLLDRHVGEPAIIFTDDNATAHTIARTFLLPVITHQTRVSERTEILTGLRSGRYGAVVTSRVLNEGVDVPEASVAVVVSGTGSVREHVQRLGRVLRKGEGKRSTLYELVSAETSETFTSERRRDHSAYR